MGIEVARQKIPENGRKWQKIHVILNRRHLPKMAGNGFPRVSRQSPTTPYQHIRMY